MKKLATALIFFLFVGLSSTALSAQTRSDIVVVLDQSASMREYTSIFMADLWISALFQNFPGGHNISLVGFSENVKQHLRIELKSEPDLKKLIEQLQKIEASSLITDFEPPIKYLLKHNRKSDMIVFITDGIPDVWDGKHDYLSNKIRTDRRYSKLNSIYARSMNRGAAKQKVFKSLKAKYEARNLELIDGHLKAMREKFGGKIVFIDVSGQNDHLPTWADKIGAHYVQAVVTDNKIYGEQLKKALMELQNISGEVLKRPLPVGMENQIESLIESKTGYKRPPPVHTADTVQEPESRKKLYFAVLFLLVIAVCIYLLFRVRMNRSDPEQAPVGLETALVSGPLEEDVFEEEEPPDFAMLDDSGYISAVRKKYQAMAYTSLEAARRYIEKQISIADGTGNQDKLRMLRQVLEETHFDRRFTLRIPVPPGTMHVLWKDPSGNIRKSRIIDISFNSILFEEPDFVDGEIDAIECIPLDLNITVKCSLKETRDNRLHVVILEDFNDNVGDQMHWIEILTRIEEV